MPQKSIDCAILLCSGESGPRRSWGPLENVTSGRVGFAGVRLPQIACTPASIRSPKLVVGAQAVLRVARFSSELTLTPGSRQIKKQPSASN